MRIVLIFSIGIFISGCTSSSYRVTDEDVTFEIHTWNQDPIIKNINMACLVTFEDLGDGYGIDGHSVFYKGNKIPNADPDTFEKLKWMDSKDANKNGGRVD